MVASPLNLGNQLLYFSSKGLRSLLRFKEGKDTNQPPFTPSHFRLSWFWSVLDSFAIFGVGSPSFSNSRRRVVLTGDGVCSPLLVAALVIGGMLSPSSKLGVLTMNSVARGIFEMSSMNQFLNDSLGRQICFLPGNGAKILPLKLARVLGGILKGNY